MNIHKNARTTPPSRAEIVRRVVRERQPARHVAAAFGISERTVRKWVTRARPAPADPLADRSSRPHGSPGQTPGALQDLIERLRRQRWTGAEIARALALSPATVARYLRRRGLGRLRALTPPVPVVRYEYRRPGGLVHVDIKKLGRIGRVGHRITGDRRSRVRGIGWEFVHVAVDDATRLAYVEVLPNEQGVTCVRLAVHPQTNGKAERFIQTLLREWAYRRPYATSAGRRTALTGWLHHYNWHRNHGSLPGCPPMSRLLAADNLMRLHS